MTEIATDREADVARRSRWARALVVGLLSAAAAACASNQPEVVAALPAPTDYRLNHPITISEMLATLDVPVGLETRYLPRGMDDNILAFAQAFKESGASELAIVLPTGAPNSYAAAAMSSQIEAVLMNAGVLLGSIHYRSYPAQSG